MFKESDHPRNEDGEFIDKDESTNPLDLITGYRDRPKVTGDGYLTNPTLLAIRPVKGARDRVDSFKDLAAKYPEGGTALTSTGEPIKMKTGYQFSFKRPEAEIQFSDSEYDEICNYIMKQTGSRLFVGFWAGSGPNDPPDTEPSFWCEDLKTVMEIAGLFNQASILNWKVLAIDPDKCYVENENYNSHSPKLDKEAILRKMRG